MWFGALARAMKFGRRAAIAKDKLNIIEMTGRLAALNQACAAEDAAWRADCLQADRLIAHKEPK